MNLNAVISRRVKTERVARGWSQIELLKQSDWPLSHGMVSLLENGKGVWRVDVVEAFAKAFGLTPFELMTEVSPAAAAA